MSEPQWASSIANNVRVLTYIFRPKGCQCDYCIAKHVERMTAKEKDELASTFERFAAYLRAQEVDGG